MGLVRWRDEYEVGVAAIDNEHRQLFDEIARLVSRRLIEELPEPQAEERKAMFAALLSALEQHFANEEEWMAAERYPELEAHKKEHRRLLDEGAQIVAAQIAAGEKTVPLLIRFNAWMDEHVLEYDKKLGEFAKRKWCGCG